MSDEFNKEAFKHICMLAKRGHLLEIKPEFVLFGYRDISDGVDDAIEIKQGGYSVEMEAENPLQVKVLF